MTWEIFYEECGKIHPVRKFVGREAQCRAVVNRLQRNYDRKFGGQRFVRFRQVLKFRVYDDLGHYVGTFSWAEAQKEADRIDGTIVEVTH